MINGTLELLTKLYNIFPSGTQYIYLDLYTRILNGTEKLYILDVRSLNMLQRRTNESILFLKVAEHICAICRKQFFVEANFKNVL